MSDTKKQLYKILSDHTSVEKSGLILNAEIYLQAIADWHDASVKEQHDKSYGEGFESGEIRAVEFLLPQKERAAYRKGKAEAQGGEPWILIRVGRGDMRWGVVSEDDAIKSTDDSTVKPSIKRYQDGSYAKEVKDKLNATWRKQHPAKRYVTKSCKWTTWDNDNNCWERTTGFSSTCRGVVDSNTDKLNAAHEAEVEKPKWIAHNKYKSGHYPRKQLVTNYSGEQVWIDEDKASPMVDLFNQLDEEQGDES